MLEKISLDDLRLDNSMLEIQAEEVPMDPRIGKPNKQEFFRVHPDESYRLDTRLLKIEAGGQWYLVARELWQQLGEELAVVKLVTCIGQSGDVFLWPIKLPATDYSNKWTTSALTAVDTAVTYWTRLLPEMKLGRYRAQKALSPIAEPEWPAMSFSDLLNEAFRDFHITSVDHPVIKQLRGMQ